MRSFFLVVLLTIPATAAAQQQPAAQDVLTRAAAAIQPRDTAWIALHASIARKLRDASDAPVPPFVTLMTADDRWWNPEHGQLALMPAQGPALLLTYDRAYRLSDGAATDDARLYWRNEAERALNPWAVLADWQRAPDVRIVSGARAAGRRTIVLERSHTPLGTQSLVLDAESALPVLLSRYEFNYLRGPERVEYRYASWAPAANGLFPVSVQRTVEGFEERAATLLPGDAKPATPPTVLQAVSVPSTAPGRGAPEFTPSFPDLPVDTVRIGAHAFLLDDHVFTEVVAASADTVYLFDAAAGALRAARDSAWIGKLFPHAHAIAVVLVNAQPPHISGARWWASTGARIIAPAMYAAFVERMLLRRWSVMQDRLDRARVQVHVIPVTGALQLGGGSVRLYAAQGITALGTLVAWLPENRFLWASDHVQAVDSFGLNEQDLVRTAKALHLDPRWTAGPHTRLVDWKPFADAQARP